MAEKPKRFYVVAGLLYPSALGAALAWLAPAIPGALRSGWLSSSCWAVFFATWFIVYHSVWFVHLVSAAEKSGFSYPWSALLSDLIDVVVLFAALVLLGLASTEVKLAVRWVYLPAAFVPISAVVDGTHRHSKKAWALLAFAFLVPIWGAFYIPRLNPAIVVGRDWIALVILSLLLISYITRPSVFGSSRSRG